MLDRFFAALFQPSIALAIGGAYFAAVRPLRGRQPWLRAAVAFLVGEALLGIALWTTSFVGWVRLDRRGILGTAAVLVLVLLGSAARMLRPADGPRILPALPSVNSRRSRLLLLAISVATLHVFALFAQAVVDPITDWDGRMTWSTLARFVGAAGSVTPAALTDPAIYVTHPRYPLLLPILQATAESLAPSRLAIFVARPLYTLFLAAMLALLCDWFRRTAGDRLAAAAILLASSVPALTSHLDGGAAGTYSDLPLGAFLGAALTLGLSPRRGAAEESTAGILLAAVVLTKNEGLLLAPLTVLALAGFNVRRRAMHDWVPAALRLSWPIAGAIALLTFWRAEIPNRYDEGYFEHFDLGHILASLPENLAAPARHAFAMLFRFDDWGLFWPIALGSIGLGGAALYGRRAAAPATLAGGALAIAGAAYAIYPDVGLVVVTWNRLLVQVFFPLMLLLSLAFRGCRARLRSWGTWSLIQSLCQRLAATPTLAYSRPRWSADLFAAIVLSVATSWALKPVWQQLTDAVGPDIGDPFLNLYFLRWGAWSLAHGLTGFWNAPFFHPTPAVMTLSDHLLGPAGFVALIGTLGVPSVAGYNLLLLFSFVATGWATYWIVQRSGAGVEASIFAGVAVAFSHFRLDQLSHIQILLMQWVPFAIWSCDRLLERPGWRRAFVFLAFYSLNILGGAYLAYMLHFPLAALTAHRALDSATRERWQIRRNASVLAVALGLCMLASSAVYFPYLRHAKDMGLHRDAREVGSYSAVTWSWLTPSRQSALSALPIGVPYRRESALFPGVLLSLFAVLGLAKLSGGWHQRIAALPLAKRMHLRIAGGAIVAGIALADYYTLTWNDRPWLLGGHSFRGYQGPFLLALAGLVLAARAMRTGRSESDTMASPPTAPELSSWTRGWFAGSAVCIVLAHPLAFAALRNWLPGMDNLRVSQRFWALALPAVGLLAAIGYDSLRSVASTPTRRSILAVATLSGLLVELTPRNLEWNHVPVEADLPTVVRTLRDAPDVDGILVLPLTGDFRETETMLIASLHGKPLANGYSGSQPVSYRHLRELFSPLPPASEIASLRRLRISHLQVHCDRLSAESRVGTFEWLRAGERSGSLELLVEERGVLLYRIRGIEAAPPAF